MSNSATMESATTSPEAPAADATEPLPVTRDDRGSTEDQIRMRAYQLYLERGGAPGDAVEDWLHAEREYGEPRAR